MSRERRFDRHPDPKKAARRPRVAWLILLALTIAGGGLHAEDWPTYRHDVARSGITAERVPPPLVECWAFQAKAAPAPAWGDPKPEAVEGYLELRRIHFDDVFQLAVAGGGVYFGSSANGKVYCLDASTGRARWTKITDGPVRLAPTIVGGRVFVGSDDGHAYCLNAADGSTVWSFRAAPDDQRVLGSGRMISLWPLRSGLLVDDGVAYLAAGVFPAEGLFLYALDAGTGREIWRNDTCGEDPQSRISLQGYMLASKTTLYAPMARVSPAAFDRADGKLKYTPYFGKAIGGTYALLSGEEIYTGTGEMIGYKGETRDRFASFAGRKIVVTADTAYVVDEADLAALDRKAFPAASRRLQSLRARKVELDRALSATPSDKLKAEAATVDGEIKEAEAKFAAATRWKVPCACHESLILAGDILFAGGDEEVMAVDADSGKTLWTGKVRGTVKGLAAAAGRLFASTNAGMIYAFGPKGSAEHGTVAEPAEADPYADSPSAPTFRRAAGEILDLSNVRRGFCLVAGLETGQLALELAKRSELTVYAVDADAEKVAAARKAIDAAGFYGDRVSVQQWPPDKIPYSDYFANLIVSETSVLHGKLPAGAENVSRMLKPLGGTMITRRKTDSPAPRRLGWNVEVRGPLPGAGSWTHQFGNPANNACGDDRIVKAPLGVLWFGRPGPGEMVNRHQRAAGPLSIDGRLFIQGENTIMAHDAYNGLKLWQRDLRGAMRPNASHDGSNLAVSREGLFVAIGDECLKLDPASGETKATYGFPAVDDGGSGRWGCTAVTGGSLYGTRCRSGRESDLLFAIDTKTGEHRWVHRGTRIPHIAIAIGDGRVFFVDACTDPQARKAAVDHERERISQLPKPQQPAALAALEKADVRMVVALDADSGEIVWRQPVDLTHCGEGALGAMYNDEVLVLFGVYLDGHYWQQFFAGEFASRRVTALSATDGEFLWSQPVGYRVRPVIIGNTLHAEPWAFDLQTGEQRTRVHPVTGQTDHWQFARPGHHCGCPIGSANCLFFRSYCLGYYDLVGDYGTMHFAAQRPGCWVNAIPAGGLLLFPEASAGCMCPFPNMCSVAFKPAEVNKAYSYYSAPGPMTPVKRLAINLGAPGDRTDSAGNLWLGYPRPGGSLVLQFKVEVGFHPGGKFIDRNSSYTPIGGTDDAWLFTSAALGLKKCVIPLLDKDDGTALYRVRLAFADPDNAENGRRVFDVKLQGKVVLEDFDPAGEAGGRDRAVWKEFPGIEVSDKLAIELAPKTSASAEQAPILQAVEVVRERIVALGCGVPDFLLSTMAPRKSGEVKLGNLRDEPFEGTLHMTAPNGFQVEPREVAVNLAASARTAVPLEVAVSGEPEAGDHQLALKLVRSDGGVEVERAARLEHLGRRGRLVLNPVEDASVGRSYADTNRGLNPTLVLDGGSQTLGDGHHALAYLKFRLDVPGKPMLARLRIHNAGNPTGDSGRICLVEEPWTEKGITYNTRPKTGRQVARLGRAGEHEVVECRLDPELAARSELGLVIDPTGCDGVDYLARESDKPPELVIEYEPR